MRLLCRHPCHTRSEVCAAEDRSTQSPAMPDALADSSSLTFSGSELFPAAPHTRVTGPPHVSLLASVSSGSRLAIAGRKGLRADRTRPSRDTGALRAIRLGALSSFNVTRTMVPSRSISSNFTCARLRPVLAPEGVHELSQSEDTCDHRACQQVYVITASTNESLTGMRAGSADWVDRRCA